jgi:hypothetical protein
MRKLVWVPTEKETEGWELVYGEWPHGPYHNCPSCNPIRIQSAGLAEAIRAYGEHVSENEQRARISEARTTAAAEIARGE